METTHAMSALLRDRAAKVRLAEDSPAPGFPPLHPNVNRMTVAPGVKVDDIVALVDAAKRVAEQLDRMGQAHEAERAIADVALAEVQRLRGALISLREKTE